jgi:hypothetical protein
MRIAVYHYEKNIFSIQKSPNTERTSVKNQSNYNGTGNTA